MAAYNQRAWIDLKYWRKVYIHIPAGTVDELRKFLWTLSKITGQRITLGHFVTAAIHYYILYLTECETYEQAKDEIQRFVIEGCEKYRGHNSGKYHKEKKVKYKPRKVKNYEEEELEELKHAEFRKMLRIRKKEAAKKRRRQE